MKELPKNFRNTLSINLCSTVLDENPTLDIYTNQSKLEMMHTLLGIIYSITIQNVKEILLPNAISLLYHS